MEGELRGGDGKGGQGQATKGRPVHTVMDLELGPTGPEGSLVGRDMAGIQFS